MKIVIDARLYGLENAGLGRYVMNLIDRLNIIDSKNTYYILLRKKYYDTLSFPDNWIKVLANFRHYSLKEQFVLPIILYKIRPDIVHFPHFNVPIFYFGKFVVTIHDLIMHKFADEATTTLPSFLYRIKRYGYTLDFSIAIKRSSNIIVPTNEVKKEVQKYYPSVNEKKIVRTYEGGPEMSSNDNKKESIIVESIIKKYKIKKPYFIYFGNAYPHKNLQFLFKGIKELIKSGTNVYLLLSTPRSIFSKRLKDMISEGNVDNNIVFPGFISDYELFVLLKGSVGFLYPSLMEGFGLQGIEALNAGTLVLVSDIPVFKEVYGDSVLYFNPNDTKSLVKRMNQALNMKQDLREEIIRKGKEFVKRYSWDKMAKETLEVYEKSSNSI